MVTQLSANETKGSVGLRTLYIEFIWVLLLLFLL